MRTHKPGRPHGPGNRAFIAAMNALVAFATACVVWLLLFQVFSSMLSSPPPFMPVIVFALLMGALSFVLDFDFILRIFGRLWKLLVQVFSRLL
jgi:uncharacterized YccA/Bax inhibitor family protein